MLNFQKVRTRPRIFQQLTGLTLAAFETLLADFERAYDDDRQQRDRQRPTPRQRRPGGGAKQGLRTTFLGYLSQYLQQVVVLPAGEMTPTVDAAGLARLLGPEQAERQLAEPRQILGAVA